MKKTMIISLVVLFSSILFTNCEDEEMDVPVNFEFRLLNADGAPSTIFDQGENFEFSFLVINNSTQNVFIDINDFFSRDFFRVYKLNTLENEKVDLGKPYGSSCIFPNAFLVNATDTLKIEVKWFNNTNQPFYCDTKNNQALQSGDYTSGFSTSFNISSGDNTFKTEEKSFVINFTIN